VSLGVGLPSVEGERSLLRPLLSSIVGKQRTRERNPKQEYEEKECEMVPSRERGRYFIAQEASHCYSMGAASVPPLEFNSIALRTLCRASVIQTVKQIVQLLIKSTQRRDSHAVFNTCCGLVKVYITHHQPTAASGKARQYSQD
jgi:hypothetical protein